ncbi:hypothetical protein [Streptomyces sp. NPDC088812]|uniref:hypothetical protein n=1 Tax=Streptomyces sp. NPDC088812 TaxID=3365905 RepID=UPI00380902A3
MSEPQYRYPHPLKPHDDIVFVQWHVASHTEMDTGSVSPLAAESWDDATSEERERWVEKTRAEVAEEASRKAGRRIGVGEVSYTVHRGGESSARPDEEPTPLAP